jgi:hypothetical protein
MRRSGFDEKGIRGQGQTLQQSLISQAGQQAVLLSTKIG